MSLAKENVKSISDRDPKAERTLKRNIDLKILSKSLRFLQSKYSATPFVTNDGKKTQKFNIEHLRPEDLKFSNPKSRLVFDNVMRIKNETKKQVSRELSYVLLGTSESQLRDPFFITKNAVDLLAYDQDAERASYLCRISQKEHAVVGMNTIMEWHFEKKDQKAGIKCFHERSKFGIPSDPYTFLKLFDGVAKTTPWGASSRGLCEKMLEIFKSNRAIFSSQGDQFTTSVFNACLSVLVKNFEDRQALAWEFFDELSEKEELELSRIYPDARTFTILLQGIKKYTECKKEEVTEDKKLTTDERIVRLLDLEAGHVKTATVIFDKVLNAATPPKPATDEMLNRKNIRKWNKSKINIDFPLVSTFIASMCGRDTHYAYAERALGILRQVSPDVDKILKYVAPPRESTLQSASDFSFPAEPVFKKQVDLKLEKAVRNAKNMELSFAESVKEVLPSRVVSGLDEIDNFNPEVRKARGSGSGRFETHREPLIDLKRESPTTTEGKPSDKKQKQKNMNEFDCSINKFMLNQVFDSLLNLGRFDAFVKAFYYSLIKWGGARMYSEDLQKCNILGNFLSTVRMRPHSIGSVSSIMDGATLEAFMFKVGERGRSRGFTNTNVAVQVFRILACKEYHHDSIPLTRDHIDKMCSLLIKDLHYYNDYNKKRVFNYGTFIEYDQMVEFLHNLVNFVEVHEQYMETFKVAKPHGSFYGFLYKAIKTLELSKWKDSAESTLYLNKLIVKCGILYHQPKHAFPEVDQKNLSSTIEVYARQLLRILGSSPEFKTELKLLKEPLKEFLGTREEHNRENHSKLLQKIYDRIAVDSDPNVKKEETIQKLRRDLSSSSSSRNTTTVTTTTTNIASAAAPQHSIA
ncbi:uncharacterized protein LODBEIA_P38020 [Lodderomyces beijingensis]|uniref:Uncharacterized protein n=1 Tax=Lodderomyces beijingensis TaxID=1775926 RepID=A0ABP0ZN77_9ASCO